MTLAKQIKTVPGKKTKNIMLFALSTCAWCKKTKALLAELGLEYDYVDVDLLFGLDREEAYETLQQTGQNPSFPTLLINNGEEIIVGFQEEKIKTLIK